MMLRQLSLFTLISAFLLLAGCGETPPPEEPCNFIMNKYNRRVSWAETPIRFYADSSINNQMYKDIIKAMKIWNQQFNEPVFEIIGHTDTLPNLRVDAEGEAISDGYNGIYIVSEGVFRNTNDHDEQARASISYRGDHIYEADVLIDASESFFYGSGHNVSIMERSQKVSFLSLMVHEFGHVLGLGHIESDVASVMYPRLGFGQYRATITESDFESLSCEY